MYVMYLYVCGCVHSVFKRWSSYMTTV